MSRIDEAVKKAIVKHINDAIGEKKDASMKAMLLFTRWYEVNKPAFAEGRVRSETRIKLAMNFLLFTVQFEGLCVRAYRPLSGSQSVTSELLDLRNKTLKDNIENEDQKYLHNKIY